LKWYDAHHRNLPWRLPALGSDHPDPYRVLVSEAMLQQTQVATVIPYFNRFMEQFGTVQALAAADEQAVLRLWQGLGYYSRARNLRAAARRIVEDFDGQVPSEPEQLLNLPGVGRYTAGAVASIAFGRRAAILDGNVMRVLARLDCIETDPREKTTQQRLWARAEQVLPRQRVGDFNSALMELGATVCTPRNPQCLICPVRAHCQAAQNGKQESIPLPKRRGPTPLEKRWTYCIEHEGRWLIEQRPMKGRWAGLWQFVTLDAPPPGKSGPLNLPIAALRPLGTVQHALTHRRYEFIVQRARLLVGQASSHFAIRNDWLEACPTPRSWVTLEELDRYPLSRPQLRMVQWLTRKEAPQARSVPPRAVVAATAPSSGKTAPRRRR
jgi:A/G-specific adenine glycosylase